MRRRLALIVAGLALLVGSSSVLQPTSAGILCPPGCVLAGAVSGSGGFPDPTSLRIGGDVTVVANSRSGAVANAVAVGETYHLYIDGSVSVDALGVVSGTALFHASTSLESGYQSFGGTVQVSGTKSALRLNGSGVEATLAISGSSVTGTVVSYG